MVRALTIGAESTAFKVARARDFPKTRSSPSREWIPDPSLPSELGRVKVVRKRSAPTSVTQLHHCWHKVALQQSLRTWPLGKGQLLTYCLPC